MRIRTALATAATALAITSLAACSDAADETGPSDSSTSAEQETEETTPEESTDEAAPEEEDAAADADDAGEATVTGAAEVTIDGTAVDMNTDLVVCQPAAGDINIAVGDAAGTSGVAAIVTDGDAPTVKSVAFGSTDGSGLAYQEGAGMGEASATRDGSTFTISGSGMAVDSADPTAAAEQKFEITVTCDGL